VKCLEPSEPLPLRPTTCPVLTPIICPSCPADSPPPNHMEAALPAEDRVSPALVMPSDPTPAWW